MKKVLHQDNLQPNYQHQLLGNKPATNEQLYQYAQHLGLSGQEAQQFVQKLSDSFKGCFLMNCMRKILYYNI